MSKGKKSFLIYYDSKEVFDAMTDEEVGQLVNALLNYAKSGNLPSLNSSLNLVFLMMKKQIDRDAEKYTKVCEKNRENINKRWNTKNTTGKEGIPKIPPYTKHTDTDTDTDTDKDTDIRIYIDKFNLLFKKNFRITSARKKKLKIRLKEFSFEEVLKALEILHANPFYRGKNDRGWVADPDFLIRSDEQLDKFLNKSVAEKKPKNIRTWKEPSPQEKQNKEEMAKLRKRVLK